MEQVLLYSIAPQHMINILNGHKTIEVRKRDLPQWAKDKLARGEKVIGYGYCTKEKPILSNYYKGIGGDYSLHNNYEEHQHGTKKIKSPYVLNGLVVVKFEVDKILTFKPIYGGGYMYMNSRDYAGTTYNNVLEKACLTSEQLEAYGNGKDLYAHHLMNIQPVEMELGEFYRDYDTLDTDSYGRYIGWYDIGINPLTKAPQSFQTVWVEGE